jgi:diketogulonate reductase-like aldo/keto reductase
MAQLALAWVTKVNPYTSTVILGATKPEQVIQNLGAINVLPKLTPEIMEKIEKVLDNKPTPTVSYHPLSLGAVPLSQQAFADGLILVACADPQTL